MDFFASTDTETLPIFGDSAHSITIKRELTAADEKKVTFSALINKFRNTKPEDGGDVEQVFDIDIETAAFRKVEVWLVDWTLPKPIDTPKAKRDALKALKPSVFAEIARVIDEYVKGREEKKVLSSTPA